MLVFQKIFESFGPDAFRKLSFKLNQKVFEKLIIVINMWMKSKIYSEILL